MSGKRIEVDMLWRIAVAVLFFLIGCLLTAIVKGQEEPTQTTMRPLSSLVRQQPEQTWSEIEIAIQERDGRLAREAEEAEQKRIQELSERAKANDSGQNGLPLSSPAVPGAWSGSPGVEQWRSLVSQYPWDVDRMLRIMERESGGDPTNHPDGSYEYLGLFQIADYDGWYYNNAPWYDGAWNIQCAYEHWVSAGGYGPWAGTDY